MWVDKALHVATKHKIWASSRSEVGNMGLFFYEDANVVLGKLMSQRIFFNLLPEQPTIRTKSNAGLIHAHLG
jgi:hypothetical protein